ncbi:hypothetical protein [Amycolatopsis lurida]|uniref:hypothetical protein n=1 Tax=Amycolatopsis lurida TaxID=31959 RepID=UPI0036554930
MSNGYCDMTYTAHGRGLECRQPAAFWVAFGGGSEGKESCAQHLVSAVRAVAAKSGTGVVRVMPFEDGAR